jgi:hypothetical protein
MTIKETARKIALGIATVGLSNCAVGSDPVPPPQECMPDEESRDLMVKAMAEGRLVTIDVFRSNQGFRSGTWSDATVNDLLGAEIVSVGSLMGQGSNAIQIVLRIPDGVGDGGVLVDAGAPPDLAVATDDGGISDGGAPPDMSQIGSDAGITPPVQNISFTLNGTISNTMPSPCNFSRAFQIAIYRDGAVQVTEALPLRARQPARIAIVRRDDDELHLEARTRYRGQRTVEWRVSDGEMVRTEGDRLVWRAPREPGLYQVELLVDYGDDGFALDTMTFEVA